MIDTTHSTPKIRSLFLKKYLETKVTQDEIAKTFHISKEGLEDGFGNILKIGVLQEEIEIAYHTRLIKHGKYAISFLKRPNDQYEKITGNY